MLPIWPPPCYNLFRILKGDSMSYYFSAIVEVPFEEAVNRASEELKKEGFGIMTEIDVRKVLKEKLGVDFRPYRILGACNPRLAYEALQMEENIGTMLPCNVVVQEHSGGRVEISAIDPVASMQAVTNRRLLDVAHEVRKLLMKVIDSVQS
jgi:uncharacterized protein (DUF302 family)